MTSNPNPEGWLKEFYPVDASNVPKSEAVAHSLQKWRGLRPEALVKYGLDCAPIPIDGDSCALCEHYLDPEGYAENFCKTCPLKLALGRFCDAGNRAPWQAWAYLENPEPMIEALEETLAREVKEAL